MSFSSSTGSSEIGETGVPPWPVARLALSRAIVHPWLIRELLRDLDDERYPFCSLTAVETDHGKWAMGRCLGRCLAMVRVVSNEALAPAAVVAMGDTPPTNDLARKGLVR
jgi:hypothetical protein